MDMPVNPTDPQAVYPGPPAGLVRLVKIMGAVLVLLFIILVAGLVWKATRKAPPPVVADVVMELGIDPGSIRHMELDGSNLVLSTDKELLVIDLKLRKVTLRSFKP